MTETHQFVRWALGVTLAEVPRSIGVANVKLVLVCLANHASADGKAFPSQGTVAAEVGIARRDVQNALTVLEDAGHITRNGTMGRATSYRMGYAAEPDMPGKVTGYPVKSTPPNLTGDLPGHATGNLPGRLPGYPVTNVIEENSIPRETAGGSSESPSVPRAVRAALLGHGIDEQYISRVWEIAQADTTTDRPEGRLMVSGQYAAVCLAKAKAERAARFAQGPKCPDHSTEIAANCRSCLADVKCGQRPRSMVGQHYEAAA
jgi:hypothetical protein